MIYGSMSGATENIVQILSKYCYKIMQMRVER